MYIYILFAYLCIYTNIALSAILKATSYVGSYTLVLVFNNDTIQDDRVMFTSYNIPTRTLYFQTVPNTTAMTDNILCRISSQKRVIYGPNGCTLLSDRGGIAIEDSNCILDEVRVQLQRRLFSENWYKSKLSVECAIPGDIRICAGPLRLSLDNRDAFFPYKSYSAKDLLSSRMQFLDGLIGPLGKSPYVVRINMVMPAITLVSSCVETVTGMPFNGTYSNYEFDPYPGMITTVWKAFKSNERDFQRIILKRNEQFGIDFQIGLATTIAANAEYDIMAITDEVILSSLNYNQRVFLNWVETIQYGYNYSFTQSDNSTCWGVLTLPESTDVYTYIKPPIVTAVNVSYNINPRVFNAAAVCNYGLGRLDVNGYLMLPNTMEGDKIGGDVVYVYPGLVDVPVYVPPNPNLAFRFDCDEAYPKSAVFTDIAGTEWPRISLIQEICLFPFLSDELIESNIKPDEKFIQCQKMGGYTFTKAQTLCARPITSIFCQKGWIYFDGRCFYKFNTKIDGRFASTIDQGDNICSQLNKYAQPLVEIDFYTDIWLLDWYIYYKPDLDTASAYRVPVFQQPYCKCYITNLVEPVQCPCYDIRYSDEPQILIFPVCFYYTSVAELEPMYADVQVSLNTALLWVRGQVGPVMNGIEAICKCFPGSADKNCNAWTCPLKDILALPQNQSTPLVTFYKKCYNQEHGSCYNGQPGVCQCRPYYGPSASIFPQLDELYQFIDVPCGCPAGIRTSGLFEINGRVYNSSALYLPCSGINQGVCVIQNNTNDGQCFCNIRPNLVFGGFEYEYDGKGCGCRVPIQPYKSITKNGKISTEFCNHKGVCCPFGETFVDPIGNLYKEACVDREAGVSREGCACDNGLGGSACTCVAKFNFASGKVWNSFNNGELYYIDLGEKRFQMYIELTRFCGEQTSLQVYVSNQVGKSSESVECLFDARIGAYVCATALAHQYAVVRGIEDITDSCVLYTYPQFFEYCGYNNSVNVFAGRFFDIPAYRGPNKYIEDQSFGTANFGCTTTECMCNSLYGGAKCAAGVSSLRYFPTLADEVKLTKFYCGETVSLPNLLNVVAGRGVIDTINGNCSCSIISNVEVTGLTGLTHQYFYGKACECEMMYNEDRKRVLPCAGHGVCKESWFPYGVCEVDVDKYIDDALYTPYVEKKSSAIGFNKMTTTRDTYVLRFAGGDIPGTLYPTPAPTTPPTTSSPTTATPTSTPTTRSPTTLSPTTRSPTLRPTTKSPTTLAPTLRPTTRSPTLRPTTKSPTTRTPTSPPTTRAPTTSPTTKSPTPDPYPNVYLYSPNIPYEGDFGYEFAQTMCNTYKYFVTAKTIDTARAFLSVNTTTGAIASLPTVMGFPSNAKVYGPTGIYIGIWEDILTGGVAVSMLDADVLSSYNFYWTGGASGSDVNCGGWNIITRGVQGYAYVTTNSWINGDDEPCDGFDLPFLCIGVEAVTPTPTRTPTASPVGLALAFYSTGTSYAGDFTFAFAQTLCENNKELVTFTQCAQTFPFLTVDSAYEIVFLPEIIGFSRTIEVYGPGGIYIGMYDFMLDGLLETTLVGADVFDPLIPSYWTGGEMLDPGPNCEGWTALLAGGISGNTNTDGLFWVESPDVYGCEFTLPIMCGCLTDATAAPTRVPTTRSPTMFPTTSSPTRSPTLRPTKSPTSSPTRSPTRSPTKAPTVAPTTRSPTRSPTEAPTVAPTTRSPTSTPTSSPTRSPTATPTAPTSSPTFDPFLNREMRYMYLIPEGAELSVYNMYSNISLTHLHSSPVNITISPDGQFFDPVLWKDVVYRVWNMQTNITETLSIDFCNPGMPSWIPGEYQLQSDGVKTCPTIDECILTVGCADELAPSPTSGFPDLRACVCEYEVVVYTGAPQLSPLDVVNVDLFDGGMTFTTPEDVSVPDDALGSFFCNSFIDRTINCMLAKQTFTYAFKCSDEPIGCYDQSIGLFFGAFNDQNVKFPYPVNQSDWGEAQYKGVASILNNLTYHTSDWEYTDPFKTGILDRYYWVDGSTTTNVIQEEVFVTPMFYQSYILQTDPYMYTLLDIPPPLLSTFSMMSQAEQFELCYAFSTIPEYTILCEHLNSTAWDYKNARMPGFYGVLDASNRTYLSFDVTLSHPPGGEKKIRGVEIYNSLWQKCGGVYSEEALLAGATISCLGTNIAFTNFNSSMFIFRVLGVNSIYDLPGATLNSEYFPSPADPFVHEVDLGYYSRSNVCIVLPLAAIYDIPDVFGVDPIITNERTWPQRQWFNESIIGMGLTVYGNYTLNPFGDVTSSAWKNISDLITELNVYPENYPLQLESYLYNTKPVDYINNQYDRDYLYQIWAVRLSRRQCGAENIDCLTFDLGECVMDTSYNQYWYNIGDVINYEVIGDEGGCYCNHAFPNGFYNFPLFCAACETGYGPYSITELSYIIQYNMLVTQVYTPNMIPVTLTGVTESEFELYYSCRYPSGMDPIPSSLAPVNFCAGHGIVQGSNTTSTLNITVWDKVNIISCNTLMSSSGVVFTLQSDIVTSQYSLVYTSSEGEVITIIGSSNAYAIYWMRSSTNIQQCIPYNIKDNTYPKPFRTFMLCEEEDVSLTCGNTLFMNTTDTYTFNEIVYLDNPFILYIKSE